MRGMDECPEVLPDVLDPNFEFQKYRKTRRSINGVLQKILKNAETFIAML